MATNKLANETAVETTASTRRSVLRRAAGEPNTELEVFLDPQISTSSSWRIQLRYSQELPTIEKVLGKYALRRSNQGLPLSLSTGGSSSSLASIAELVEELLTAAVVEGQAERVDKLLQFQAMIKEIQEGFPSKGD